MKCVVAVGEGSSRLGILLGSSPHSLFDIFFCERRGFKKLMFPLWFALQGGSFVFLDVGPSISFLVSPLGGAGVGSFIIAKVS